LADNQRTPLTTPQVEQLRAAFPYLPQDYFDYMGKVGWGETDSGRMIYEGPTGIADVYGPQCNVRDVVLLGDDFQGYCFGFNLTSACYGEVSDAGVWEEWSRDRNIWYYVGDDIN
jgi:hypothetical protein